MNYLKKNELPLVSVIIPVYNSEKFLKNCLDNIIIQNYPIDKLEIIAVDNCSTDNSPGIIKSYEDKNVKYLLELKKGPSAARNSGIKKAKGEYLIFIDSDCIANQNLVIEHIKAHLEKNSDNKSSIAIGGGIKGINRNLWAICDDFCSWFYNNPGLKPRQETNYLPTANLSVHRKIINDKIFFDENKRFGEDLEFCKCLKNNNYKIYFVPSAIIGHINLTSFKDYIEHAICWGSGIDFTKNETSSKGNQHKKISFNLFFASFNFIFHFLKWNAEIVYYSLLSKRFHVIIFFPFIFFNRICFGLSVIANKIKSLKKK